MTGVGMSAGVGETKRNSSATCVPDTYTKDVQNIRTTLVVYGVIFAMKLAAYFMSGVIVLLAEALHTLADIFVSGFLLVAARLSRRAADGTHMFGYGRAQNIAALVAATLFISFTCFELLREAVPRLFLHEKPTYQHIPLAVGVLLVSMAIAAYPLLQILRQKTRGAAAKAQFMELINDELGLLAAFVGTLFAASGCFVADPLAAIAVAAIIAVNAFKLFRENASTLLGKAPPEEFFATLRSLALSVPGVADVHDIRAEYVGPETVHADLHIRVAPTLTVVEAHAIAVAVDILLETVMGKGMCQVHVDTGQHAQQRQPLE
jgi:cation diffusion facilitator family transporter